MRQEVEDHKREVIERKAGGAGPTRPSVRAISRRTAGVVPAWGWMASIRSSTRHGANAASHRSARHIPQSPNAPGPNNVPLPNSPPLKDLITAQAFYCSISLSAQAQFTAENCPRAGEVAPGRTAVAACGRTPCYDLLWRAAIWRLLNKAAVASASSAAVTLTATTMTMKSRP
jgi:hypothetical protein